MSLERLWAGWRAAYVAGPPADRGEACVLCGLTAADDDAEALVLARQEHAFAVMNLYPYGSGHLMVAPHRHEAELDGLDEAETLDLVVMLRRAVAAVRAAFAPDGINVGANLGRAAGAGIPGHLHVHVLPRWSGDTNFMTSVAEVRVLPEDLTVSWAKLRAAWPAA